MDMKMTKTQQKANLLMKHFSAVSNSEFQLKNGICSLYDEQNNEMLTIELPSDSDSLVFNCTLSTLNDIHNTMMLARIMRLNFEMKAMQGCWLALNEDKRIMLCFLLPIELTNEQHFCDTAQGFMEQVAVLRPFIEDLQLLLSNAIPELEES